MSALSNQPLLHKTPQPGCKLSGVVVAVGVNQRLSR
jgi:hypothetical protein